MHRLFFKVGSRNEKVAYRLSFLSKTMRSEPCPMSRQSPDLYPCYSLYTSINRFEVKMAAGDITVSSFGTELPNRA